MREYLIYCWTNNLDGKQYVGYTRYDEEIRLKWHLKSPYYFGLALRKHGKENFSCKVFLRNLTLEEALQWEIYYIDELETLWPDGYNLTKGGNGNHNQPGDYKLSEVTRKAISIAMKGFKHSEESKRKMSEAKLGKKFTPEHIANMSQPRTQEHRMNISKSLVGRKVIFSEDHKENLRKAATGVAQSREHKLAAALGHSKMTQDTIRYIRKSTDKTIKELCEELSLTRIVVHKVRHYQSFKDVT